MLGTLIKKRFQLRERIGQGGMGTVHKAYDRLNSHIVALKQVTVSTKQIGALSSFSETSDEKMALANEFSVLASLRHPNIISVLDYGFDELGNPFYTMDLLDNGVQIKDYALGKSQEQKISYLLSILQALRYLHQRGILHRDLKPANILVSSDNIPKLLDFGLALDTTFAKESSETAGTLAYLAPEVLQGTAPSIMSDLYACGVIAHEIFTGKHPFSYETQDDLIQQILLDSPKFDESLRDSPIGNVIHRLLSKDPSDRYKTALDTMRALCDAADYPLPAETMEIRESFLVASTFVGREQELETLKIGISNILDDSGQAYLIGGESGVGKTRLMDELRSHALVNGITVMRGQAITETGQLYKLWRDVLPNLLLITNVSDDEASILAKLVPNISELLERKIIPSQLPESVINTRLPLIITNLVVEAAKVSPLLIMFEDLQWSIASIKILKQVISSIEKLPVMVVGNYRSDEAPNLPDNLDTMQAISLERLTEENIKQLSTAMLGNQGNAYSVIDLIQRESEGNAFFIVEVVRALAEEVGQLSKIGMTTLPAQVFTGGIEKVIERRISKLPLWALYPIQVSSIIGRQINPQLMQTIDPNLDIQKWLSVCGEGAVFSAIGEDWQFTHDKIREYVITNLDYEQTKAINLQVADAIESLYGDQLNDYVAVLAEYYRAAEHKKKEAIYTTKAINILRYFKPQKAYDYAQRAIQIEAHNYHNNPKQEWANLNMLLGKTAMQVANFEQSRKALDTSLSAYEELEDEFSIAVINSLIGEYGFKTGKYDEAIPLLQQSLPILEKHGDWEEIGYAYMNLSIILAQQGEMETALPYFERCKEAMLKTQNDVQIAKSYNNLALAYENVGDLDKGVDLHNKALAIRKRIKDKRGIAYSLANLAEINANKGDYKTSKTMHLDALSYIRESGDPHAEVLILNSLAMTENNLGQLSQAISYSKEALKLAQKHQNTMREGHTLFTLAQFYLQENKQQAKEYYFGALTIFKNLDIIPRKISIIDELSKLLAEFKEATDEDRLKWLSATIPFQKNYNEYENIEAQLAQIKENIEPIQYETVSQIGQSLSLNDVLDLIMKKQEVH